MAETNDELPELEEDETVQVVTRRHVLGLGAASAAGAWVIPEILCATPRAAALSGTTQSASESDGHSGTLAFTGDDIERDALVGAALIGAGWALVHWAARGSRTWPAR